MPAPSRVRGWLVRAVGQRLGCYTFGGGMARIGLGVYDGQLSVVVEVIDEPVALF
jgi:hypothetical protein